jgi:heme/copper-type cytochrome/quinol oxidase subunit 2
VVVSATYPRFQPSTVAAKKGQVITLKVTANDTNHTFNIDELGINVAVSKGQTITKETKLDKVGTFTFYCAVPGHRGAGMEGTLQIIE